MASYDDPAVRVGISDWFTEISQTKRHVDQARRAIDLGRSFDPGEPVYRFERYRSFDLFEHLGESSRLDDYVYPPLLGLLDYDHKHGMEFGATLYRHLRDLGHAERTCQQLGIHRNTLYQRLDRTSEIMGQSWSQPEIIPQLELGFEVLRYRGLFAG